MNNGLNPAAAAANGPGVGVPHSGAAAAAALAANQNPSSLIGAGPAAPGVPPGIPNIGMPLGLGADSATGLNGANGVNMVGEGAFVDENRRVLALVSDLMDPNRQETALLELSRKREQVPELALILWHSFGDYSPPSLHLISKSN